MVSLEIFCPSFITASDKSSFLVKFWDLILRPIISHRFVLPSLLLKLYLDSSEKITVLYYCKDQFKFSLANCKRAERFFLQGDVNQDQPHYVMFLQNRPHEIFLIYSLNINYRRRRSLKVSIVLSAAK